MSEYAAFENAIRGSNKSWLVSGAAGFIGSHLVERLLLLNQRVVGLDNFLTGHEHNLTDIERRVGAANWANFKFINGDIRDLEDCAEAVEGVDFILHQAALGSVPRSISDPITTNAVNVNGFLNLLLAGKAAGVKRFVYASSSSVYGDSEKLPKVESEIGRPLSPYAVSKLVNEHYAGVISVTHDLEIVGLRYFNVYGPRQDPDGAYAAVIPRWIANLKRGEVCEIYGDGETSRDFCFVGDVVQANLLAATTNSKAALNQVYNVAFGRQTTLNQLYQMLLAEYQRVTGDDQKKESKFGAFRTGDVRHSLASIALAQERLGFKPTVSIAAGLVATVEWFLKGQLSERSA